MGELGDAVSGFSSQQRSPVCNHIKVAQTLDTQFRRAELLKQRRGKGCCLWICLVNNLGQQFGSERTIRAQDKQRGKGYQINQFQQAHEMEKRAHGELQLALFRRRDHAAHPAGGEGESAGQLNGVQVAISQGERFREAYSSVPIQGNGLYIPVVPEVWM